MADRKLLSFEGVELAENRDAGFAFGAAIPEY